MEGVVKWAAPKPIICETSKARVLNITIHPLRRSYSGLHGYVISDTGLQVGTIWI
jgi:hypothetical protein